MARIDDTERVFDVSKPNKSGPTATSKPVIVGHRPTLSDPMVKEGDDGADEISPKVTSVPVMSEDHASTGATLSDEPFGIAPEPASDTPVGQPPIDEPSPSHHSSVETEEKKSTNVHEEHKFTTIHSLLGDDKDDKDKKPSAFSDDNSGGHLIGSLPLPHPPGAGPKRSFKKILLWLLAIIVVAFAGLYLAVDAGLIKTGIKLPFSIFGKQSEDKATDTAAPDEHSAMTDEGETHEALPAGFTNYLVPGTKVNFGYPTGWGAPSVTMDPGFSQRSASATSDGTYAHLVSFATNKDIQIAITSSKLLPAARTALYYDFLQWCVGTHDKKFYKQALRFITKDGVDTPSTVTCDQGPLDDATKLDELTIEQAETKGADGQVLGHLYTKNLTDSDYPVLRVKDSTMKHAADIKKLLGTIHLTEPESH